MLVFCNNKKSIISTQISKTAFKLDTHAHYIHITDRNAEKPPNNAPDATPTQKPIVKPVFIRVQHDG